MAAKQEPEYTKAFRQAAVKLANDLGSVAGASELANKARKPGTGLMAPSDHGSQYCSHLKPKH